MDYYSLGIKLRAEDYGGSVVEGRAIAESVSLSAHGSAVSSKVLHRWPVGTSTPSSTRFVFLANGSNVLHSFRCSTSFKATPLPASVVLRPLYASVLISLLYQSLHPFGPYAQQEASLESLLRTHQDRETNATSILRPDRTSALTS